MKSPERPQRSMARQFARDYFVAAILPIVLLLVMVLIGFGVATRTSEAVLRELVQDLSAGAEEELRDLGEQVIYAKARDVAKQIEIYLRTTPVVSVRQLTSDPRFQEIVQQTVGETGYIAVHEAETDIVYVHPRESLVGEDLSFMAEENPEFWAIFHSPEGEERAGYYEWQDPDTGAWQDKFMVVTPVGTTFGAKTLMVAATTTIDEFSRPAREMQARVEQAVGDYEGRVAGLAWSFVFIGALLFALAFVGVLTLGRRAARRYTAPIEALATMASGFGEGQLTTFDQAALLQRQDEIGVLAQALATAFTQVESLVSSLQERTVDLERQSLELQTAADVGRVAISILDIDTLIEQVVTLLQERFGFYHVGLFLLDETERWLEYQAGVGQPGVDRLERGDRIAAAGGESWVSWCASHAEVRMIEDVAAMAEGQTRARNLLPGTQTEVVLPLIARGKVIGVLDVQSDRPMAFTQEIIVVLQTVSGQVAVALENARLFVASQEALAAERRAYGEMRREAWMRLLRSRPDVGFRRDVLGSVREAAGDWDSAMHAARREGRIVQADDDPAVIAVPIIGGGDQVLSVLRLRRPEGVWSANDRALLETLAERLSQALESARLYHETQRREASERLAREVTANIRQTLDVDTVLQTAIREIADALDFAKVEVRMGLEAEETYNGES